MLCSLARLSQYQSQTSLNNLKRLNLEYIFFLDVIYLLKGGKFNINFSKVLNRVNPPNNILNLNTIFLKGGKSNILMYKGANHKKKYIFLKDDFVKGG